MLIYEKETSPTGVSGLLPTNSKSHVKVEPSVPSPESITVIRQTAFTTAQTVRSRSLAPKRSTIPVVAGRAFGVLSMMQLLSVSPTVHMEWFESRSGANAAALILVTYSTTVLHRLDRGSVSIQRASCTKKIGTRVRAFRNSASTRAFHLDRLHTPHQSRSIANSRDSGGGSGSRAILPVLLP